MKRLAACAIVLALLPCAARGQADSERAKNAKALVFDRKYAEARQAWQEILKSARGADADAAAFWVARSSEYLGEHERALKEYGDFLARRPSDKALSEEARTNRVGLAARLYKAGKRQHLPLLGEALEDQSPAVRYYAAFALAGLGAGAGEKAVPVLLHIVRHEQDQDLVERAQLYLLKLDPQALSRASKREAPAPAGADVRMLRVRIFEQGKREPTVQVNLPMALAELAFKALPDEAVRELRKKGYDAENFWNQLKKLERTEILSVVGEDGERIQIWIE